jgi:hypothetical protein
MLIPLSVQSLVASRPAQEHYSFVSNNMPRRDQTAPTAIRGRRMPNSRITAIDFAMPCSQLFLSPAKSQTHDMHRQQKITSGELRSDNGPRRLLAYHRDPKG